MKYKTTNECGYFSFRGACVAQMMQMNGYFTATLDNVTILPENSCNRDVRNMRTNNLQLTIREGRIISLIEEGYKIYDANGMLTQQHEDREVPVAEYQTMLETFEGSELYEIEKKDDCYHIAVDADRKSTRLNSSH